MAAGRRVLITGAGGSIGSALTRAIAAASPERMVLLDASEHNLFAIRERLAVPHEAVLGSVTDGMLVANLFRRFGPEIVFHAAALKHVPLLELNPFAAVSNNALGTLMLARAAAEVSTLILVSTDKAVNPRSIMGASKRLAEMLVAALSSSQCRMSAVRFGNVIGSSGSVVPLFQRQIAAREPVTVTHPDATRYFMTIGEAVDAILAGACAACSGRILLPDLGAPERIVDVARFLIASTGLPISFIGLRPGEKVSEDLLSPAERRDGTVDGPLQVLTTPVPPDLDRILDRVSGCVESRDLRGLIEAVRAAVPEYEPSGLLCEEAVR